MMSKCIPPSLSLTSLRPVWYMPLLLRPIPCFCMLSNLVHFGCARPAPPRDGQCAGGQEANKFTLRGFGCFEHFYLTDPKRRAHMYVYVKRSFAQKTSVAGAKKLSRVRSGVDPGRTRTRTMAGLSRSELGQDGPGRPCWILVPPSGDPQMLLKQYISLLKR